VPGILIRPALSLRHLLRYLRGSVGCLKTLGNAEEPGLKVGEIFSTAIEEKSVHGVPQREEDEHPLERAGGTLHREEERVTYPGDALTLKGHDLLRGVAFESTLKVLLHVPEVPVEVRRWRHFFRGKDEFCSDGIAFNEECVDFLLRALGGGGRPPFRNLEGELLGKRHTLPSQNEKYGTHNYPEKPLHLQSSHCTHYSHCRDLTGPAFPRRSPCG
jgi:hypothetical protein